MEIKISQDTPELEVVERRTETQEYFVTVWKCPRCGDRLSWNKGYPPDDIELQHCKPCQRAMRIATDWYLIDKFKERHSDIIGATITGFTVGRPTIIYDGKSGLVDFATLDIETENGEKLTVSISNPEYRHLVIVPSG